MEETVERTTGKRLKVVEYEGIETKSAEGASLGFGETRRNSQAKGPCPD